MSALAHATVVVARFLTTAALLVGGANGALAADPGSGPLGGVWLAEDAAPATGSAASGAPAATTVVVGGTSPPARTMATARPRTSWLPSPAS